jgi:hypothetical protein
MGRPSDYTQEIADLICERIADGESLRSICSEAGMPSRMSVFRWLADPERASFRDQYARAREEQAEFYAESIVEIADECEVEASYKGEEVVLDISSSAIARNRLRVDARKWYASKLAPKKYGEKVEQVLSGDLNVFQRVERKVIDPK